MSVQKRSREDIAKLIANDIPEGSYVNLGIGLPTNVAKFLPKDKEIFLHSENGVWLLVHLRNLVKKTKI